MPLTLATNIGQHGEPFVTALSGAPATSVVRVLSGPARVGSAGLIVHRLPFGLSEVTLREVAQSGAPSDTSFTLYGVDLTDAESIRLAGQAKGQNDVQQRQAVAAASSVAAGLTAVGLIV